MTRRNRTAKQYDLAIVGTGTAASVTATRLREAGWHLAIIDFRPFGGTCALRGCDPKKVLIEGAAAIDHFRRMQGKGLTGDVHIDWQKLMTFKRLFTDTVPEKKEQFYTDKGIDAYHGRVRFTGKDTLVDEKTDFVLGAHLVGPHAEEAINLFALAIRHNLTSQALKTTMFAYPTTASDIGSML